jgi:hypothetical protein
MDTKSLKERLEARSRKNTLRESNRVIPFDLVSDVEYLFDRDNFVADIEALLDEKRLQGDEILTIPSQMAPIASVRSDVEPKIRSNLKKRIENGSANQIIRSDPKVSVYVTIGWPEVGVAPTGEYSVSIEYVNDVNGNPVEESAIGELEQTLNNHTYFLTVRGETYPIDRLDGSILELEIPQSFRAPDVGFIHNNARKLFLTSERKPKEENSAETVHDRSRRRAKDQSISTSGPVTPVLQIDTVAGTHDVSITAEGEEGRINREFTRDFSIGQPPSPEYMGGSYNLSEPPMDPVQSQRLNRTKSNLGIGVNIQHPKENAIILGMKYRVGSQGKEGGFKFGEPKFLNFSHEILQWQLREVNEVDSTNREFGILFGDYNALMRRKIQMKFVDELGRNVQEETAVINAKLPGPGVEYRPHQSFITQFGELVYESSTPVDIDLQSWYDRGSDKFKELQAEAEKVAEGKALEELEKEDVKNPKADIRVSSQNGQSVNFDASQSSHPNQLNIEYRFDFTSDGAYDTVWTDDATASFTYPEAGTYTAIVQVRDEFDQRDRAAVSVTIS